LERDKAVHETASSAREPRDASKRCAEGGEGRRQKREQEEAKKTKAGAKSKKKVNLGRREKEKKKKTGEAPLMLLQKSRPWRQAEESN
jgi:hypothetical protein